MVPAPNARLARRLLLAAAALVLAACSPSGDLPGTGGAISDGGATAPTAPPESSPAPAGACNHPYFPVELGATRTYSGTAGPVGGYSFTDSVTDVRADGFTISADFGDLTRVQEWSCTDAGLIALTVPAGPEASVSTGGSTLELQVTDVVGVTLPADLAPGSAWTQTYQVEGVQTLPDGQTAEVTGTAAYAAQAVGFEEVSVAAGDFSALRIEQTFSLNLSIALAGGSIPVLFETVETVHFAEGVGMVRTSGVGTMFGESFEEALELLSTSTP